jgi:hypothetical protein
VTTRWRRHPQALWRRSGDRVLVLTSGGDGPLLLTGVGCVSWELLASPMAEGELFATLGELYGVDDDRVVGDIVPFLEQLAAAGAVSSR